MILFLFLFGLALGTQTPADDPPVVYEHATLTCPQFWFNFNGRCYKYVSESLSWADAELSCVSQGANLVSIFSEEEDTFIRSMIKSSDPTERPTWIGLSDIHKEGSWMWSDGCPVKFFYWSAGEPNAVGESEDCAHINAGTDKKWNDNVCSHSFPSVCASRTFCS